MQIIEVSVVGVRSAVITLTRRDSPMRFVLFPMIHLGTPGFYRAVTSRLGNCFLVVAEGIRGTSATGSVLTLPTGCCGATAGSAWWCRISTWTRWESRSSGPT
jgi:hypothetical protein